MQKFAEIREIVEYVIAYHNDLISRSSWLGVFRLLNEAEAEIKGSLRTAARMGAIAGVLLTGAVLGAVGLMWSIWSFHAPIAIILLMIVATVGLVAASILVLWRSVPDLIVYELTKSDGGQEKGDGR